MNPPFKSAKGFILFPREFCPSPSTNNKMMKELVESLRSVYAKNGEDDFELDVEVDNVLIEKGWTTLSLGDPLLACNCSDDDFSKDEVIPNFNHVCLYLDKSKLYDHVVAGAEVDLTQYDLTVAGKATEWDDDIYDLIDWVEDDTKEDDLNYLAFKSAARELFLD